MQDEGYIRITPQRPEVSALGNVDEPGQGRVEPPRSTVRFELTDKTIDFLGLTSASSPVSSSGAALAAVAMFYLFMS